MPGFLHSHGMSSITHQSARTHSLAGSLGANIISTHQFHECSLGSMNTLKLLSDNSQPFSSLNLGCLVFTTGFTFCRYTHIEAECPFINYEDLLDRLEDLICDVVDRVLKTPYAHIVYELNPNFQVPTRPFLRMNYSEAIEYLKKHNITKEDGTFYEFGEVNNDTNSQYIVFFDYINSVNYLLFISGHSRDA